MILRDASARLRRGSKDSIRSHFYLEFSVCPQNQTTGFKDREALKMRVDAIDVSLRGAFVGCADRRAAFRAARARGAGAVCRVQPR